jgi:hypothetical protein
MASIQKMESPHIEMGFKRGMDYFETESAMDHWLGLIFDTGILFHNR